MTMTNDQKRIIYYEPADMSARIDNIDELAGLLARAEEDRRETSAIIASAKMALQDLTVAGKKTRRLMGTEYEVVVTVPDPITYDSTALKRLYAATDPALRDQLMRIEKVAINAREWAKWRESVTSDESFGALCQGIRDSERAYTPLPGVKIEKR